ncbi:MAG TPA: alpha/beta hydrolase [Acidimicrobiales bacterium]|nr:alpha/beta hydrolase [Acidimicrobiales bacterium]
MLRRVAGGLFAWQYAEEPIRAVALPGWMRTVADFHSVLRGLPALALDLHGFGGAHEAPPTAWSTAEYAGALLPMLEELPEPVVVLGHSFGGRVALQLAAARPERVRALLLTGVPQLCARPASKPGAGPRAIRALRRSGLMSERRLEAWKGRHGSDDYRRARGVMRDVLVKAVNEDYEQQLRGLAVPVDFVWGGSDTVVPAAEAVAASRLIRGDLAHLAVLEGVGHLTPVEAPGDLREALCRMCET